MDLEELLECIARCGVDKYRAIEQIPLADKVSAMIANILGDLNEEQVITKATYIHAERFTPSGGDAEWLSTWGKLKLDTLPGFPLWEKPVHDLLLNKREALASIFRAYAASSPTGSDTDMDMDEFHDLVLEAGLATDEYGFDTMCGQFTKANAGSDDRVLELHEFLTMVVRISFFRANPQYGMRKGQDQRNADKFDDMPLPGCLATLLDDHLIPNARDEQYAQRFLEQTLPLPEVQDVLSAASAPLKEWYESVSAGRDFLELDQWMGALQKKLAFCDLSFDGHVVRLTEPQARAAFIASAASPTSGLTPEELQACIARTGYDKYRKVGRMAPGAKVQGFIDNLMGEGDEEDVVTAATGGMPPEEPPVVDEDDVEEVEAAETEATEQELEEEDEQA